MKGKRTKLGCLLMTVVLFAGGCGILPEEEELRKAPIVSSIEEDYFRTEEVKKGDVVESLRFYCNYRKKHSASYSFEKLDRDSRLAGVYVKVGEMVKAGTVLAELDLGTLSDEITEAQEKYDEITEQLAYTEKMLEFERERQALAKRYGKKYDEGTLRNMEDKLERLEDEQYIAELKLNEIKEKVGERQLVAKHDGIVTSVKKYEPWEWLRKGDEIVRVESEDFGFVSVTDMPENFEIGKEVTVATERGIYDAVVEEIVPLENSRHSVIMNIENPDEDLVENMPGTIIFVVNSVKDVTYVPYGALRVLGDQYAVYVLNSDGMREMRYVEVGMIVKGNLNYEENRVEIISGVTPGEVIILR